MAEVSTDARRHEFWQTLLSLGFDPRSASTGTYSGIDLDPHVFDRGIYHMKAAELILQFLFTKLDPTRFKREYFDCWPIGEPKQARDFRAHSFKWLEELRKDSVDARDGKWSPEVPVRRSYVDECKGLRFEEILWTLTMYTAEFLLGHAWKKYLKYPQVFESGDLVAVARALESCKARYKRRTRDRVKAQKVWRESERELEERIERASSKRDAVHAQYRVCRKRLAAEIGGPATAFVEIPDVDAAAGSVEKTLKGLVDSTKKLWEETAGWVEEHQGVVDMVEAVVERRANSTRLEGKRHVRLAPPAQMSSEWTRWLADNQAVPFKGADVNLQVVARMAAACVKTLRRNLTDSEGGDDGSLALGLGSTGDTADGCELPDVSGRLQDLDVATREQSLRIAKLEKLRSQLAEQQERIGRYVRADLAAATAATSESAGCLAEAAAKPIGSDTAALRSVTAMSAEAGTAGERTSRLASRWDALVDEEEYPLSVVDSAYPGESVWRPKLSLSFMSDSSAMSPPSSLVLQTAAASNSRSDLQGVAVRETRKRVRATQQDACDGDTIAAKSKRVKAAGATTARSPGAAEESMLVDDDVPEFLVG
ncbi:hypothetical protein GQ54DRAFT_150277 [Martensiomyces pterosporus]|nr:hypothetical protein GQ54DRAFT_150277 [Martensiomyces pterosporus]